MSKYSRALEKAVTGGKTVKEALKAIELANAVHETDKLHFEVMTGIDYDMFIQLKQVYDKIFD